MSPRPKKKSAGASAVFWWVTWILLTIAAFFISCFFWTPFIAERVGPMRAPGVPILWVTAVFGTWILLLVPLIIVMYAKVDKAYEDARIRREAERAAYAEKNTVLPFRSVSAGPGELVLSRDVEKKLRGIPQTLRGGRLVSATLKDGRTEKIFVLGKRDLVGVYGRKKLDFKASEIVNVEPLDLGTLKDFREEEWLRLDNEG